MPKAVVDPSYTEKFDLKSCPEGWVELRRMTYGEFLDRRNMVARMTVSQGKKTSDFEGELALSNRKVTEFEFSKCIVDHNLEDENERPLVLAQAFSLNRLDPRIGEEIATLIDKMNQFELMGDEEDAGNS